MEAVELVIECEDRFGIEISDSEAQHIRTVGDLQDLVVQKTGVQAGAACLSSHIFYRLRRALRSQERTMPEGRISPDTQLRQFFGDADLGARWDSLEASSGLVLPPLEVPKLFRHCLLGTGAVAGALGLAAMAGLPALWPFGLGFAALWLAMLRHYDRLRVELPEDASTMRELVLKAMTLNLSALATRVRARESEVREAVAQAVCDVLFVDRSHVVPNANFVRTLESTRRPFLQGLPPNKHLKLAQAFLRRASGGWNAYSRPR